MKVVAISDIHGNLIDIPKADILCISGDIMPLQIQKDLLASLDWLVSVFSQWVKSIKVDKVILVAGNHDFIFANNKQLKTLLLQWTNNKCIYLQDEIYTMYLESEDDQYREFSIYGTPWCDQFYNWAFMGDEQLLRGRYSLIPNNVDILLTHSSPAIDNVGKILEKDSREAGSTILAEYIKEKKPRYVFCGHIHSGEHSLTNCDDISIYNVSTVDESYNIKYPPLVLDIQCKE